MRILVSWAGVRLGVCLGAIVLAWPAHAASSAEPADVKPLPQPLTLKYALSLADGAHPELELARAGIDRARAEVMQAESASGWNAYLEARARWGQPPDISPDQSHNDHRIGLVISKQLYDFGRSEHNTEAAQYDVKGRGLLFLDARQQRRIEIMRRYFDVILADLRYMRDNEDMAVVYVALDKLRDRRQLGQASDIDVLKKEAEYQRIREKRTQSQNQQRSTRERLALALNRPDDVPDTLSPPDLPWLKRKVPDDVTSLVEQALANNPVLRSLQAQLAAARERVAALRAAGRPVLRGEAETFAYSRELGSNDSWRAGVVLHVPLLTGGSVDAAVARGQAGVYSLEARVQQMQLSVRQAVLDAWLSLQTLAVQRKAAEAESDYRDLYLDRSRALYDMEVRTDLGDAMVRITDAQLKAASTDFQIAISWARLDALTGRLLENPDEAPASRGDMAGAAAAGTESSAPVKAGPAQRTDG